MLVSLKLSEKTAPYESSDGYFIFLLKKHKNAKNINMKKG